MNKRLTESRVFCFSPCADSRAEFAASLSSPPSSPSKRTSRECRFLLSLFGKVEALKEEEEEEEEEMEAAEAAALRGRVFDDDDDVEEASAPSEDAAAAAVDEDVEESPPFPDDDDDELLEPSSFLCRDFKDKDRKKLISASS